MSQFFQRAVLVLALAGAVHSASAFSLAGPFEAWQVEGIGYNLGFNADVSGPKNLGEEYRWNIKTITYGFDESFLNYFGAKGTAAVMQAVAILNNLPPVSQMSANLSEFPTDTRRVNYQAGALGVLDMKSYALAILLEELGLASPERYAFTLRDSRTVENVLQYLVIKRNFDPVTSVPSSYVNDALYTYYIDNFTKPLVYIDAVEVPVDPLAFTHRAVVSISGGLEGGYLPMGEFVTGLTRDDVAGLRYLYGKSGSWRNLNIENLIPGTTSSGQNSGDCPWCPVGGTNAVSTNTVVDLALRPGVDKITFKLAKYDSLFGFFITVTNQYEDSYMTNGSLKTQTTQRVLIQPDILFSAEDLGLNGYGIPFTWRRSAPNFVNNDALNGQATLAGPGIIQPQAVITFNKLGPYLFDFGPPSNFLDELSGSPGFLWGFFDATTNAPVVFPDGTSIQELEQQALGGH
jgi:hypothetical protein